MGGGLCYEHIRPDGHETPNRHHLKSTDTVVWTPLRYETRESKTPGSNMIPDSGIPSTEVGFGQESTPSPTHGIEYMHYDSGILGNECRCMNDGSTTLPCGIHATKATLTYCVTRLAYQDGVRFCRYSTCRRMDRHRGSKGVSVHHPISLSSLIPR